MGKSRRLAIGLAVLLGLSALLGVQFWLREVPAEPSVADAGAMPAPPPMGAPPPPPFVPGDDGGRPIPQDPGRQEEQYRKILEWNRKTLGGAYERVGKKDPRWDEHARKALEATAMHFSQVPNPPPHAVIHAAAKAALEAGCDDPMVLYVYARSSTLKDFPGQEEYLARHLKAVRALEQSAYPAHRRATSLHVVAAMLAAREGIDEEGRKEATQLLNSALALLPKSVAEDEPSPSPKYGWSSIPQEVYEGLCRLGMERPEAFQWVDSAVAEIPELKAERLKVKGNHLVSYAWEARGSGFANTVSREGFEKFRERLLEAREALEASWELKQDPETAARLITVDMGLDGDRDNMELWFDRAMKADGNNLDACLAKLDWVDPKWHGEPEDLLAFGRACRNTRNWRSRIPLLAIEPHYRLGRPLPTKEEFLEYFSRPEVWEAVHDPFEEYLQHYPNDHAERSKYAAYAFYCKQYPVSYMQFQALGDNLVGSHYFSEDVLKKIHEVLERRKIPIGGPPPPPQ